MLREQRRNALHADDCAAFKIPGAKRTLHFPANHFPVRLIDFRRDTSISDDFDFVVNQQEIDQDAAVHLGVPHSELGKYIPCTLTAALRLASYASLSSLSPSQRRAQLEAVLRKAKVRMPAIKAERLAQNVALIEEMGGIHSANARAKSLKGKKAKLAFVEQFAGVGPKYARNIWMTVYDPDFRDAIALDSRIEKISDRIGVSGGSYEEREQYYRSVAMEAGREAWELDRVMYSYNQEILDALMLSSLHRPA